MADPGFGGGGGGGGRRGKQLKVWLYVVCGAE